MDFEGRWIGGTSSAWFSDVVVANGRGVLVGYRDENSAGSWKRLPVMAWTDDGLDVKRLDLNPTIESGGTNSWNDFDLKAVACGNGDRKTMRRHGATRRCKVESAWLRRFLVAGGIGDWLTATECGWRWDIEVEAIGMVQTTRIMLKESSVS